MPDRAAITAWLRLSLTPCQDRPSAMLRYEAAREDAALVITHGRGLLTATAPGEPLRCECGHPTADSTVLHRHQILPEGEP